MTQVFTSPYSSTSAYSISGATIAWGKGKEKTTPVPMLAIGISFNYARTISPQYVLNGADSTLVNIVGAPRGSLTIDSILTPDASTLSAFLQAIGSDCIDKESAVYITLSPFTRTCKQDAKPLTWTLRGVLGQAVNMRVQDQQGSVMAAFGLTAQFTTLECATAQVSSGAGGGDGTGGTGGAGTGGAGTGGTGGAGTGGAGTGDYGGGSSGGGGADL